MSTPVTEPARLTNAAIQEYAERVGEHHNLYDESGHADIDRFIFSLGGNTTYATNDESLHVTKPGDFTIFIPHFTSSRRDRFTKAHELGHYFLHYLYSDTDGERSFGRGGRDRVETEANVFASALLMPSGPFRRSHKELGGDKWALAARFEVSPQAAEVRAQVLNLG